MRDAQEIRDVTRTRDLTCSSVASVTGQLLVKKRGTVLFAEATCSVRIGSLPAIYYV